MRQRKVKNEEERLRCFRDLIVTEPKTHKGRWRELFPQAEDIYVEIGCGRGQFITTLAEQNPHHAYVAAEGRKSVLLRALEKAAQKELENLYFIDCYFSDVTEFFEVGEIAGLYLNFSDPWPKDRHAKRRLTHRRFLAGYASILKSGACIEFKSDNDNLFQFTLQELGLNGFQVCQCSTDLHRTNWAAKNITTEYEDKFTKAGKNINYCKASVLSR